jgi:hypothetical protein
MPRINLSSRTLSLCPMEGDRTNLIVRTDREWYKHQQNTALNRRCPMLSIVSSSYSSRE